MSRSIDKLYEATSTAAGTIDSGAINAHRFASLLVVIKGTGAAAPTGLVLKAATSEGATPVQIDTFTAPAVGGSVAYGVGPGCTKAYPVPPFVSVAGTGGAASTVTITIFGVRER